MNDVDDGCLATGEESLNNLVVHANRVVVVSLEFIMSSTILTKKSKSCAKNNNNNTNNNNNKLRRVKVVSKSLHSS